MKIKKLNKIKRQLLICPCLVILFSCQQVSNSGVNKNQTSHVEIANQFIDAFYSFDEDSLKSILTQAGESQPSILYYQKWAACGNYEVIQRNDYIDKSDSIVICPITVKDDLIGTLGIDFHVTDTFHITIVKGKISSVKTSSNDPELYYEAKQWVAQNRPELIEKPCEGIWEGGPTPCDCVEAMIAGFTEFIGNHPVTF